MKYDLAAMSRRAGMRRRMVAFRPIVTTQARAQSLARIMRRMLAPWLEARERITQAYSTELNRVMTTDSMDDLTRLFGEIGEAVERLVLELTPAMRDWAFRMESWHRGKWGDTLLAGANVDVRYLIGPQDAVEPIEAFLARNVALVRDVSRQVEGRIADAIFRGIQARTPAREVGRQIAEATGLARKRANNIAADQAVKLASALDAQRQREAGLDIYKYRHSGKLHPRSWHRTRDGKFYERDTGKQVEFSGGKQTYGADTIEADDAPGIPPFCGCTTQAVLVYEGEVL